MFAFYQHIHLGTGDELLFEPGYDKGFVSNLSCGKDITTIGCQYYIEKYQ